MHLSNKYWEKHFFKSKKALTIVIFFFLQLFNKKTSHAGLSSPDDYVKELQRTDVSAEHLLKSLQSVRVSLTGRPLR